MLGDSYLSATTDVVRDELGRFNRPGLRRLHELLASGEGIGFLGAGVSAPAYPLWTPLINELVEAAEGEGLDSSAAATCRAQAALQPDAVVEILRQRMGASRYEGLLRWLFRVRRDPITGRSWNAKHEAICRLKLRGLITTNYDPGIVDARTWVRQRASSTEFTSWSDDGGLERWITGDVLKEVELPVLFAHGYHSRPSEIVLAASDYRRAYAGRLGDYLAQVFRSGHIAWIGFSFGDPQINALLRAVANHARTDRVPVREPRHVAVMPWNPQAGDPQTLRSMAEIEYGSELVLYPTINGDYSALERLLIELGDQSLLQSPSQVPIQERIPESKPKIRRKIPITWVPDFDAAESFVGRLDELAHLDRWAAESPVRLVGITAWGGTGKTSLVVEWIRRGGAARRPGSNGVFAWSFYADPSPTRWAAALIDWAKKTLSYVPSQGGEGSPRPAEAIINLLLDMPVVLILDGLELIQEGRNTDGFGRLLDGVLREVLAGVCRQDVRGLVILTSRFPFADLEGFDGSSARMLSLPSFTSEEGGELLASLGGGWLAAREREELSRHVGGHGLALGLMGALLHDRIGLEDLDLLRKDVIQAGTSDSRVQKVIRFYGDRLDHDDRLIVSIISLFAHPVNPAAILTVAKNGSLASHLDGWDEQAILSAARVRPSGLVKLHKTGMLSTHPLVRDTFRAALLPAAATAAEITLHGVPTRVTTADEALLLVEAVELLLVANKWTEASSLEGARIVGDPWRRLPAPRLGQRLSAAFAGTPERRHDAARILGDAGLLRHLNHLGLFAIYAGNLGVAEEALLAVIEVVSKRREGHIDTAWGNLSVCQSLLGELPEAIESANRAFRSQVLKPKNMGVGHAWIAYPNYLAGNTWVAETLFLEADRLDHAGDSHFHMSSLRGTWWANFLLDTNRLGPAQRLVKGNLQLATEHGWKDDLARYARLEAQIEIRTGNPEHALKAVSDAARLFRDGDYLMELVETLPVLASTHLALGDFTAAMNAANEAIDIARPRRIKPALADALVVRAEVCVERFRTGRRKPRSIQSARDDVNSALRIAKEHGLRWKELRALVLNASMDDMEGLSDSWSPQVESLREILLPAGLDSDPLGTVERDTRSSRANWPL